MYDGLDNLKNGVKRCKRANTYWAVGTQTVQNYVVTYGRQYRLIGLLDMCDFYSKLEYICNICYRS